MKIVRPKSLVLSRDADRVVEIIKTLRPLLVSEFPSIPFNKLLIRVKHLERSVNGQVLPFPVDGQFVCEIACNGKRDLKKLINTVAHEFTHLEQMSQGRLNGLGAPYGFVYWSNILMKIGDKDEVYLNSPWEVEARARADEFTRRYHSIIFPKHTNFFTRVKNWVIDAVA